MMVTVSNDNFKGVCDLMRLEPCDIWALGEERRRVGDTDNSELEG